MLISYSNYDFLGFGLKWFSVLGNREFADFILYVEEYEDHYSRDYTENWRQNQNGCESGDDSDVEGPGLNPVNVTLDLTNS